MKSPVTHLWVATQILGTTHLSEPVVLFEFPTSFECNRSWNRHQYKWSKSIKPSTPAEETAAVKEELKFAAIWVEAPLVGGCVWLCWRGSVFRSLYYTSANHRTQWSARPAGASNNSSLPLHLPLLASISEELQSCFSGGIHGGCCFLITAAHHVLLGTDCAARHRPSRHRRIPI